MCRRLPGAEGDNQTEVSLDERARQGARRMNAAGLRAEADRGRKRFGSKILPAYARRSWKVDDVLTVLYLGRPWTGDFRPAFEQLPGEDAAGQAAPSATSR